MTMLGAVCFHCGEAHSEGARYLVAILGEPRPMCCPGCQAVAETIVMAGLDEYYQQRFACAEKPSEEELQQVLAQADNLTGATLERPWVRRSANYVEAVLQVEGITCAACGWLIERHLNRQPGVLSARLNLSNHELLVRWQEDGQSLPNPPAPEPVAADQASVKPPVATQSLANLVRQVATLGYRARVRQPDDLQARLRRERKASLGRLAVGGLGAMQAMMYATGLYFAGGDMDAAIEAFLRWTSLLVAVPVVTYAAWPFHAAAWRSVRACFAGPFAARPDPNPTGANGLTPDDVANGTRNNTRRIRTPLISNQLTMDVPVSVAIIIAFIASAVATFSRAGEVYFESVTMFVFFISIGRYLEMLVRHRAAARNDRLGRFAPTSALRLSREGESNLTEKTHSLQEDWPEKQAVDQPVLEENAFEQRVPLSALALDDLVLVKPGTTVPADGVVMAGISTADESFLTGESLPQEKAVGSRVLAGSINGGSPLTVKVTATGADTVFAHIQHLQSVAQSRKPQLAKTADRLAGQFVVRLLISAIIIGGIWLVVDPSQAVWVLVALLVASCPCALSLATSAATAASGASLASSGFYLTGDNALEALASVTDVVFDKTGTLTDGEWRVIGATPLRDSVSSEQALAIAAALECHSEHPLAQAFSHIKVTYRATDVQAQPGYGLIGTVSGRKAPAQQYRLGRADFAWPSEALSSPANGHSDILLADSEGPIAWFSLQEQLRPSALEAVQWLRAKGMRLHILSGDQGRAVSRVADLLSISDWRSDCSPEDKLAYVTALQADDEPRSEQQSASQRRHSAQDTQPQNNGVGDADAQGKQRRVMVIGDGVNDGPVMGAAHLAVAMSSGADLARQSADIILLGGDLMLLPRSLMHARKTLRVIKQNLGWALGYNVLILPLAAMGWVTPWMAAIGMSASSLLVVLNALRLSRLKPSSTEVSGSSSRVLRRRFHHQPASEGRFLKSPVKVSSGLDVDASNRRCVEPSNPAADGLSRPLPALARASAKAVPFPTEAKP